MGLAAAKSVPRDSRLVLAADVGGTHVRIGLVCGSAEGHALDVVAYRSAACAGYAGLEQAIDDFLLAHGTPRIDAAVIACAGYALEDGQVISANLPWPVHLQPLRERLGLRELRLVNDFQALTHAAPWFAEHRIVHLCGPETAPAGAPVLVIGPGTGFGSASWIPTAPRPLVVPSEAGQASLAVSTALELEVLRVLLRTRRHVSVEHVLSGPGLLTLYSALCTVRGTQEHLTTPQAVSEAALAGADPSARAALTMFCALLGSVAADLVLACGAYGGVTLAGGVLPGVSGFLQASPFAERFLDKGVMRQALERVPVRLVEHGQLGVLGAATWYLAQPHD